MAASRPHPLLRIRRPTSALTEDAKNKPVKTFRKPIRFTTVKE